MSWVADALHFVFRSRRRALLTPPTPPRPEDLRSARLALERADDVLREIRRQDPAVDRHAARAEQVRKENHLGPAFWSWAETLGGRKDG